MTWGGGVVLFWRLGRRGEIAGLRDGEVYGVHTVRKNGSVGSRVVDWMYDRSILLGKTNEARDFFEKGKF